MADIYGFFRIKLVIVVVTQNLNFFVSYQPPENAVILIGVGQGGEWWQKRKSNTDDRIVRVKKHADV